MIMGGGPCLPVSQAGRVFKGFLISLTPATVGPGSRAHREGAVIEDDARGWFFMDQDPQGFLGQDEFLFRVFHDGKAILLKLGPG